MNGLVVLAALALSSSVVLLVWAASGFGRSRSRALVASNLQRGGIADLRELTLQKPTRERAIEPMLSRLAGWAQRITPNGSLASLERKLVLAGRPTSWPLERILAAKVLLGGVGVAVAVARVLNGGGLGVTLLMVAFAVLLYFTPDVILSARATERQRNIVYALPDVLDQMTICMEAGLGFEAAMARTSRSHDGPLSLELVRTLQEIQVGVGRRQALRAMAERTGVRDLRHFVTAVLQAESYGVPIGRVLRQQASELRRIRRQRAEEQARKLPLKLMFPLLVFILPPLFVVLVAPAGFELFEAFSNFN